MGPRDPGEIHRQASFLELFFDLCFVVAVAMAAAELHHALAEAHILTGIVSYVTVFFAIWWAWMNFTWFASAYDNDDVPFRIGALVQIIGALILAAGVPKAFGSNAFDVIFIGYGVMRFGLIAMWLRAAAHDSARRTTNRRYAIGLAIAMAGWSVMFFNGNWPLWGWWLMALVELGVPVWAEWVRSTPWHSHHIAERYGLFTIIVLGESILAATHAVQRVVGEQGTSGEILTTIAGGLLIVFSLWWLYFAKPAHRFLVSNRVAFVWGYGHYFIFAAVAAVGAGLSLRIDHLVDHSELSDGQAAAAVTVPVAVFLLALWALQVRPSRVGSTHAVVFPVAALAVLSSTLTGRPVLAVGLITGALVITGVTLSARAHRRSLRARAEDDTAQGAN